MKKQSLHFTLGPVQGFVGQARRTRDLWAGSFLLSYLAGQAMKAVLEGGGEIVFPEIGTRERPTDPLLAAILKRPISENPRPEIGSLPNRFKAGVQDGFDPERCEEAVREAWKRIASSVWERYVEPVAAYGKGTKEIWERQVEGFWEMSWVIGEDPGDRSDQRWLDLRKNWRTHHPPSEPGDKCTLMGSWQELSGYVRAREREAQDRFWDELRKKAGTLNLGEHERLCAIALIKRLFPEVAKETIGWELNARTWPSTPYMAAVPWIEEARNKPEAKKHLELVRSSGARSSAFGEYNTNLACPKNEKDFARLDGNFFHRAALENERATPDLSPQERKGLLENLKALNEAVGHPASTFYALLLMDGDRLGSLLQNKDIEPELISRALAEFTAEVEGIIGDHCGRTVYAGGDDVLALLPVDRALQAAAELRCRFRRAFGSVFGDRRPVDKDGKTLKTTISAGLVYATYNTPLRAVMQEAHRLLDEVAKDENGRDSIAASVLAGSGRTVQWVSAWDEGPGDEQMITSTLTGLAEDLEEEFAGRFFYNVRERFDVLTGDGDRLIEDLDAQALLVAEYLKSRERDGDRREAEKTIERLLKVCRRRKGGEAPDEGTLDVSGAMLVRFLATKGRGVER
ncbi:CRISPR-associated protein, Cmr2 family [Rubrobacter xylanophilus DSM 9941]|uniref:CRISPR-associated protein, Cmr2 family n=1 Tax=Rubrobacter xylanophilus (strain DSM 9941 / JCM 11954 / NBRC 16129 / PRD-1) TaxID=266117 RepID=Q1AZD8_RUBXD|nr:type III-B CRISPR-associated protein Cas10/Cmr2 [Rubrobacter xylanophilus]ABG03240.1 CRISPR-associated protein, Cmr2 family [Rubrobacter xylanophilus DSM 9941]